jgi:hypothetical protein
MKSEIIKEMIREQSSQEAMAAHTIRIPHEISDEIREFCGQTGIQLATVWRKCLVIGWSEINRDE